MQYRYQAALLDISLNVFLDICCQPSFHYLWGQIGLLAKSPTEAPDPAPLSHPSTKMTVPGPFPHSSTKLAVPGSLPHPPSKLIIPGPFAHSTVLAVPSLLFRKVLKAVPQPCFNAPFLVDKVSRLVNCEGGREIVRRRWGEDRVDEQRGEEDGDRQQEAARHDLLCELCSPALTIRFLLLCMRYCYTSIWIRGCKDNGTKQRVDRVDTDDTRAKVQITVVDTILVRFLKWAPNQGWKKVYYKRRIASWVLFHLLTLPLEENIWRLSCFFNQSVLHLP